MKDVTAAARVWSTILMLRMEYDLNSRQRRETRRLIQKRVEFLPISCLKNIALPLGEPRPKSRILSSYGSGSFRYHPGAYNVY